jgi:NAD(P)H-flavin reductase
MAVAAAEPAPGPLTPRPCRVVGRRRETRDTVTLRIDAGGLRFRPGQFNMLYAFGVGEVAISISGDPARTGELVHTVRSVGMVSDALCRLRPGEWVGVRGPFGSGWPVDLAAGRDVLVLAGGVGMAPLRPALYALARRPRGGGHVTLVCGARTPDLLLYERELHRLGGRRDVDVLLTVDAATRDWTGHVGVVPAMLRHAAFDPARALAMLCGPEAMMRFTVSELRRLGVPDESIWVSLERNMHCGVGLCGHCQVGPVLVCRDGPVFRLDAVAPLLGVREV